MRYVYRNAGVDFQEYAMIRVGPAPFSMCRYTRIGVVFSYHAHFLILLFERRILDQSHIYFPPSISFISKQLLGAILKHATLLSRIITKRVLARMPHNHG